MANNKLLTVDNRTHGIIRKYSQISGIPMGEIASLFMKYGCNLYNDSQCRNLLKKYKRGEIR